MKKKLIAVFLVLSAILLASCEGEKVEIKNMEQIYKEEGVPVKIEPVKKGTFKTSFTYNTTLSGLQESSVYASVGDRLEKVYVKVGDYVKKDQILATFPLDNPEAQYQQAKVGYETAKNTYDRYARLYETGGISQQNLDNVKAQLDVAKANFDAVGQMVKVKASMSGYITKVEALESENIQREQLLFTIADTRKLKAKINIAENEIKSVKKGFAVIAEWDGEIISGRITEVGIAMNPYTKTFTAVADFDNPGNKIPAGATAKITIESAAKTNAIVLERKHLVREDENYFVFLAEGDKAVRKQVKLGTSKDLSVEITEGLQEGDLLITEGALNLDDQTKIKIIK